MPAFATHYLFSEEMMELLPDKLDFELVPSAVAIGTQGPDVFFFHRFLPLVMPGKARRKVGSAIHNCKPAELFDAFADYLAFSANKDVAKSFIYGYIMHYALDRKCHPFVYSLQERMVEKNKHLHHSTAHNRIEHNMDTYILNQKLGLNDPADFDYAKTLDTTYDALDEIGHLMAFVVPRVTEHHITEKEAIEAIKDTITMEKILRNKGNAIMNIASFLDILVSPVSKGYQFSSNINPKDLEKAKKYGNINKKLWFSPYKPDEKRYDSYLDLFDIAKDECVELLYGFEQICMGRTNGAEITQNISFLKGVEV